MIVEKITHNSSDIRPYLRSDFLYFDIETTGLQKRNALIYLIGSLNRKEDGSYQIHQWFAENPDQEEEILQAFLEYADSFQGICHFNGDRFDLPFLEYRCSLYDLAPPFQHKKSRDLYRLYKPMQKFLGLSGFRQRDLEEFLVLARQDCHSGKDCIKIYRDLIKYRDLSYAAPLLLHNREDLLGLAAIESLKNYDIPNKNPAALAEFALDEKALTAILGLQQPVPRELSLDYAQWHLHFQEQALNIRVQLADGYLKNYYPNPGDYYYLPGEDTAIHKSVGAYIQKDLRQKAAPHNCYTRFLPQAEFKHDFAQIEHYLLHNLPIILSLLSV